MSQDQAAQIEVSIEQAKEFISLANALEKLHKNAAFKKIIVDGFFKDEAVRLVNLKADPNTQSPESQAAIIKDIDAIGSLRSYFKTIYQRAAWAEGAIEQGNQELIELAEEEA